MSKINIKYISDEALATIKANMKTVTKMMTEHPNDTKWLNELCGGNPFVTKKYVIEDFALKIPTDKKDRETDFQNSVLLYERLNHLPKYVLSDERFWCWINFDKGYRAAMKLMPVNGKESTVRDHWLFGQSKRRSLFFGVLSRCYYRVALTVDPTLEDAYELSRFVIENPERFRNFTWRNYSSEKNVILGAVKAEKKVVDNYPGLNDNSDYYTQIAKDLSKFCSVKLIDTVDEKEIEAFVFIIYDSLVKEMLAKKQLSENTD